MKTILVVDDDSGVREMFRFVLEQEGYQVREAINGKEALDDLSAPSIRPDLILLDLMMPVMDGWEFLRVKNADPRIATIPVIVISAATDRVPNLQASALLPKPVRLKVLLETVRKFSP